MHQAASKTGGHAGGRRPADTNETALYKLYVAPDLEITRGDERGNYYVVQDPCTGRYLRLHPGAVAILRSFDGGRTVADVANAINGGVATEQVEAVVSRLVRHNLIVEDRGQAVDSEIGGKASSGSADRSGRASQADGRDAKQHRLRFLSLPLVHCNPDAWLDRHRGKFQAAAGWPGRTVGSAAILAGVAAAAASLGEFRTALRELPLGWELVPLLAALALVMILHELAHAVTLKAYGGKVPQIGVMLLYLTPALFCNTSDTWRLPVRRHRVAVVSAGVFFQFVVAGTGAVLFWLLPSSVPSEVVRVVGWFAVINAALGISNSIPFLKQDGYWMLALALDRPNLRAEALGWSKSLLLWVLYGQPPLKPRPSRPVALAAFGVLYSAFVTFCVGAMLLVYQPLLLKFGPGGALAWSALAAGVAGYPVWRAGRGAARRLRESPLASLRASCIAGVLGACLLLLATSLSVPAHLRVAYRPAQEASQPEPQSGFVSKSDNATWATIGVPPNALHLVTPGTEVLVGSGAGQVRAAIRARPHPARFETGETVAVPIAGPQTSVAPGGSKGGLPEKPQSAVVNLGRMSLLGWFEINFLRPVYVSTAELRDGLIASSPSSSWPLPERSVE